MLLSGVQAEGEVTGLEAISVTLGAKDQILNLSAAEEVAVRMASDEPLLVLAAVARCDGKEVARVSHPVLLKETGKVYLADLVPTSTRQGPWPLAVGMSGSTEQNLPIIVDGKAYPKGLGLHANDPPARATYRLARAASVFRTVVAFNDSNAGFVTEPVYFEVFGDGKQLWKSKAITSRAQKDDCLFVVSGVDVLELRVRSTGANAGAHAVWLDPILIGADEKVLRRIAGKK
jgi:hypothetical protein